MVTSVPGLVHCDVVVITPPLLTERTLGADEVQVTWFVMSIVFVLL